MGQQTSLYDESIPDPVTPTEGPRQHTRFSTNLCYEKSELINRKKSLEELLDTERVYTQKLGIIVDVFAIPLSSWCDEIAAAHEDNERVPTPSSGGGNSNSNSNHSTSSDILTKDDVSAVFANAEQLLGFHRELLDQLEKSNEAGGPKEMMAEFLKAAPFLKMYSMYINNFSRAADRLTKVEGNASVRIFIRACELQKVCQGLQLRDFLIMPVQRIPRYRLLLAQMLKYTKEVDPLYEKLAVNLTQISEIAAKINADVTKMQMRNKVLEWQHLFSEDLVTSSRLFVKDAMLIKICRGGPKKYQFVLFNDLLVYGIEALRSKKYNMKRALRLDQCFVVDGFDGPLASTFMIVSKSKSFVVQTGDANERREWVEAITECMRNLEGKSNNSSATPAEEVASTAEKGSKGRKMWGSLNRGDKDKDKDKDKGGKEGGRDGKGAGGGGGGERFNGLGSDGLGTSLAASGRIEECEVWWMSDGKVCKQVFLMPRVSSIRLTFDDILRAPRARAAFRKHLVARHCTENVDFYEDAMEYEGLSRSVEPLLHTPKAEANRAAKAKEIMDRFIRAGSPEEVNLSSAVRQEIVVRYEALSNTSPLPSKLPADLFSRGVSEIVSLMKRGFFVNFRMSEGFSEVMALLGAEEVLCGMIDVADLSLKEETNGISVLALAGRRPSPSPSSLPDSEKFLSASTTATKPVSLSTSTSNFSTYSSSSAATFATMPVSPVSPLSRSSPSSPVGQQAGLGVGVGGGLSSSPPPQLSPLYNNVAASSSSSTSSSSSPSASAFNINMPHLKDASQSPCLSPLLSPPGVRPLSRQAAATSSSTTSASSSSSSPPASFTSPIGSPQSASSAAAAAAAAAAANANPPVMKRTTLKMKITPCSGGLGMNLANDVATHKPIIRGYRQMGPDIANPAVEAGVHVGDVLEAVDGVVIESFQQAINVLREVKGSVELTVVRTTAHKRK